MDMIISEIRLHNMRALAKQIGGITAMANRLDKTQGQISHLIGSNPIKNIGSRIAREVDNAFGLPEGWMDQDHTGAILDALPTGETDELSKQILVHLESLTHEQRLDVLRSVKEKGIQNQQILEELGDRSEKQINNK